jgi:putative restriction endonuclease
MATTRNWTREELILAFNLYLKLPFGKMHSRTNEVVELANLLERTSSSIAIRLSNFASCDPFHKERGVKGMIGGIAQCQPIWDEFFANKESLIYESERILAERQNLTLELKFEDILKDVKDLKGAFKIRAVKTRVNQNVFRQIVVANYSGKCAITGIDIPELLVASHIIPWAENEKERLNPENGVCLSVLYDSAYDKGLISINEEYKILLAATLKKKIKSDYYNKYFSYLENEKIKLPKRYLPNREFLQYHLDNIFEKSMNKS